MLLSAGYAAASMVFELGNIQMEMHLAIRPQMLDDVVVKNWLHQISMATDMIQP